MVLSNKEWLDKMDEIISAIQNGGCDSQVIEDMLSNMWISSATYNVGDYVLYNNNIWKCLIQNSNIAPTEGSTWTSVKITNEISTLNSNLNSISIDFRNSIISMIIPNNNTKTYTIGVNGALFILARNRAIFMVSYQSANTTMVFGSLPSGLTISKSTESSQITIENKIGYTLNGIIITT